MEEGDTKAADSKEEEVTPNQEKTPLDIMKPPTPVLKVEREGNCYW